MSLADFFTFHKFPRILSVLCLTIKWLLQATRSKRTLKTCHRKVQTSDDTVGLLSNFDTKQEQKQNWHQGRDYSKSTLLKNLDSGVLFGLHAVSPSLAHSFFLKINERKGGREERKKKLDSGFRDLNSSSVLC